MANCPQINNTTIIGTSAVTYDSTPLPCLGIQQCDGLNDILITLDTIICNVKEDVDILTDEVTNITEEVMLITEDIININNQLGICCPTTTTTSSSSTTSTTTSTSSSTTTTTTTAPCNCITFHNGEFTIQEIKYNNCSGQLQNTIIQVGETKSYCGCCGITYAPLVTVTQGAICISGNCQTTTTTSSSSTSTSTSTTTSTSSTSTTSTSSTSTTTTTSTTLPPAPKGCYSVTFDGSIACPASPGHMLITYTNCNGVIVESSISISGPVTICVAYGPEIIQAPEITCGSGTITMGSVCNPSALIIQNESAATIEDITGGPGPIAIYTPIAPYTTVEGTHGNWSTSIVVTISDAGGALDKCMSLYINEGFLIESISFNTAGIYTFSPHTINATDEVKVLITNGPCT